MFRTGKVKALETGIDLSVLGTLCSFGFALARWKWPSMPDEVGSAGTAAVMAIGGAIARYFRHRIRYGK